MSAFNLAAAVWTLGLFAYFGSIVLIMNGLMGAFRWRFAKLLCTAQFVIVSAIFFGFLAGAPHA